MCMFSSKQHTVYKETIWFQNLFFLNLVCFFQVEIKKILLKFGYSEKATTFEKIFHLKFDVTEQPQILSWKSFSNFVAFSEYPNLNETVV